MHKEINLMEILELQYTIRGELEHFLWYIPNIFTYREFDDFWIAIGDHLNPIIKEDENNI